MTVCKDQGRAGVTAFLRGEAAPNRAVVQVPGDGMRMRTADFKKAAAASEPLSSLLIARRHALSRWSGPEGGRDAFPGSH